MGKKHRRKKSDGHEWTANDVRAILHNPIYTGIGPFPCLIEEQLWIQAQKQSIQEDGLEAALLQMKVALAHTFGHLPEFMQQPGWIDEAQQHAADQGIVAFFATFLADLRTAYA